MPPVGEAGKYRWSAPPSNRVKRLNTTPHVSNEVKERQYLSVVTESHCTHTKFVLNLRGKYEWYLEVYILEFQACIHEFKLRPRVSASEYNARSATLTVRDLEDPEG